MKKLILVSALFSVLTACSYNPVQYEQQRAFDNAAHNKQMN